jgi:hypothetical protein
VPLHGAQNQRLAENSLDRYGENTEKCAVDLCRLATDTLGIPGKAYTRSDCLDYRETQARTVSVRLYPETA